MKNDAGTTEHVIESWKSAPMGESEVNSANIQIGAMVTAGEHHYKVIGVFDNCSHTGECEGVVVLRPADFADNYRVRDDQDNVLGGFYVPVSFLWQPGVGIYEPSA